MFKYLFDCICVFRVESRSFWRTIFLVIGGKDIFLLSTEMRFQEIEKLYSGYQ